MYKGNKKRLMRVISAVTATALVFTAIPAGAKTSKKSVTQIQVTSPYSVKDKKVTTTLTLKKGSTFKIKTSVSPKTADKKLIYKSSKKKVATVSKTGKIKAKKVGKTTITIQPKTNKKVKAVIKVTVVKKLKKVTKMKLDQSSLSLTAGGSNRTAQLKASIVSPKKPTNKKFNWFTSNKEIATVNNKGLVTAKKAGQATITVTAADGRGAKAVCKVSVTEGSAVTSASSSAGVSTSDTPNVSTAPGTSEDPGTSGDPNASNDPGTSSDPNSSQKPDTSNDPNASNAPSASSSATPATPATPLTIVQKSQRTGIKQGEKIQLTADGSGADQVTWTVGEVAGVTISTTGLLQVAADADTTQKIKVTATTSANVTVKTATAEFSIVRNYLKPLTESQILLNKESEDHPLGLTYHSPDACSKVVDPERGEVVKFDSTKGYTSSSGEVLAWIEIDPIYAGKVVSVSAYMKYDANPNMTDMDLVIAEGFNGKTIASVYNTKAGEWYYLTNSFILPNYNKERWDGNKNRIYISLPQQLTTASATYYIDGLSISVEKSTVDQVELSVAGGDVTEIFQNHELQCTAQVSGTKNPSQQVDWSIEPPVAGATISDSGKLKVENAEAGAVINIKATSKEDPTKSDTKQVTVRAQTIGSVTVSVKDGATEFYPNNTFQFIADVTSAGEPDESVIWSVTPSSDQVGIREDGLLTVGNVAGGTKLTVKATSVFDNTKFGVYEFEVLADMGDGAVNKVTIEGASETIAVGSELSLEAKLETTGNPKKGVIWSLTESVEGVSLKEETGSSNTLMVEEGVARNTSITVRATSEFDKTKYDEITVEVVDINDTSMEYWEDFNESDSSAVFSDFETSNTNIIWKREELANGMFGTSNLFEGNTGVVEEDAHTIGMNVYFSDQEDYIQFSVRNTSDSDQTYLLSFMVRFYKTADMGAGFKPEYKLPLKLVSVDQKGDEDETPLKECEYSAPCDCQSSMYLRQASKEFHEMFGEVQVPAGETLQLRLKLNGPLPTCEQPGAHPDISGLAEPVLITLDNVLITSGKKTTINMTTEAGKNTQKFNLNVDDGDTVTYYTNCNLAQLTHNKQKRASNDCTNFGDETLVATVDAEGVITALHAGETVLVAKITHADKTVEYRQCIVKVK